MDIWAKWLGPKLTDLSNSFQQITIVIRVVIILILQILIQLLLLLLLIIIIIWDKILCYHLCVFMGYWLCNQLCLKHDSESISLNPDVLSNAAFRSKLPLNHHFNL